jgi:hypothetical protein
MTKFISCILVYIPFYIAYTDKVKILKTLGPIFYLDLKQDNNYVPYHIIIYYR